MTTILSSLPPGFRFHPTDEELILYLNNKVSSSPISVSAPSLISEIDLYKLDPWELPGDIYMIHSSSSSSSFAWLVLCYDSDKAYFGDRQWFCFSPGRERKYPKGARPNRRAGSGYWKATGIDRAIVCSDGWQYVGVKKSLIFYKGRAPKGTKTNWIMQEYRLPNSSSPITGSMTVSFNEWNLYIYTCWYL